MKASIFIILLCCFSCQILLAQQDDGVVSLDLPVRNSLVFNRFAINPTFTFVREQNKFISFNNKRQRIQFDNAPVTFLGSYSGRFAENIGAGIAAFQQNYGVLSTIGGLLNFAYNIKLNTDSNLTFGLNAAAYSSGINTSNIVTNFDDPSLQNVPQNFLLSINPGINYGMQFLDFGISVNNLVLYNFESSNIVQDDPQQGIQAHVMHTGYFDGRGFFEDTKFTGILMSEFTQNETIISGIASLNVPKGLWFQIGYNSRFGASGGLGLNITKNIALEYNIEKAIGELVEFGSSHEITLAYRIIAKKKYDYSGDEKVSGLFTKKRNKPIVEASEEELAGIRERAADRKAKAEAEKLAAEEAEKQAEAEKIALAEAKAKAEAEERAKREAEVAKAKGEAQLKAQEQAKIKAQEEAIRIAEQKEREEIYKKEKELADARLREQAEAQAKKEAEEAAKKLAEQKAKAEAEQLERQKAEAKAKALAEKAAQQQAEEKARKEAEAKAKAEAAKKAKELEDKLAKEAEEKAKAEAAERARLLAEENAKREAAEQAKIAAEQKAKREAEEKAKALAEKQAAAKLENEKDEADTAIAEEELAQNPTDDLGKSIANLAKDAENSKRKQKRLLEEFESIVEVKDSDLKDLKEENDLSDQGITVKPKAFKSVTAENNKLAGIKSELEDVIKEQSKKIDSLNTLYEERYKTTELDEVTIYYRKKIEELTQEQSETIALRNQLDERLETIRVATEFEKRRRIKRAAYDNEEDRFAQDRAVLQNIKRTTKPVQEPYTSDDFDFGEDQGDNIKILKNVSNAESGYYLIIAVHSDINKRNEFLEKVVASGRANVDFFYDVNTSKYYIYYSKFSSINAANKAMDTKGDRPYNTKMSLVKIEN